MTDARARDDWQQRGAAPQRRPKDSSAVAGGVPLGKLWDIPISAAWSVLIIFALVAGQLAFVALPLWHPEWSPLTVWVVALSASVLFFVSILLHELSHSVVAKARGMKVQGITLFVFGGVSRIEGESPSPKTEFLVAVVGPLMSLLLAVAGIVGAAALGADQLAQASDDNFQQVLASLSPGATLLLWLGTMNLVLAAFNMVPGFPLDGGRVLRAILWWLSGSLEKATRWASWVGQAVAFLLIAWGIGVIMQGFLLGGVWRVLIGWFLYNAAKASYRQMRVQQALGEISVARLMQREPPTVDPDTTLGELVRIVLRTEQPAVPVVHDHELQGLVSLDEVRQVPESQWDFVAVNRIMKPAAELSSLQEETPAQEALSLLNESEQLPVLKGRELVGMLRRKDVMQWLALQVPGVVGAQRQ